MRVSGGNAGGKFRLCRFVSGKAGMREGGTESEIHTDCLASETGRAAPWLDLSDPGADALYVPPEALHPRSATPTVSAGWRKRLEERRSIFPDVVYNKHCKNLDSRAKSAGPDGCRGW